MSDSAFPQDLAFGPLLDHLGGVLKELVLQFLARFAISSASAEPKSNPDALPDPVIDWASGRRCGRPASTLP